MKLQFVLGLYQVQVQEGGWRMAMPHIQRVTEMHIIGMHRAVQAITVNSLPSLVVTLQLSLPPVLTVI